MKKLFISLIAILSMNAILNSQTISGVINSYTSVSAIAGSTFTVPSTAGFSVGGKVLLIQMKGATITTGNIATFGTITSYNNAGNYEYLTISSMTATTITTSTPPCQTYTISGGVQLVSVPVYTNATITAPITCPAWNGVTGGVIALEVTNTLTMNSNINANGMGFRGGAFYNCPGCFLCGDANYANTNGGTKGEGIAVAPAGQGGNRAPLANGGGGTGRGNPGAGGGANYGLGGRGGFEFFGWCALTIFGMPGNNLSIVPNKAFLGGGGGGGYADNGLTATAGSNGGGLVFLNANTIVGNSNTINCSGNNVVGNTDSEGAGGGGAGGGIYLWTNSITSTLNLNVRGGSGGNILSTIWSSACHGPGAGGGGGYVYFSTPVTPVNAVVNATGGAPGTVLHVGPACAGTPHGATAGGLGGTLFNLPYPTLPDTLINLGPDTIVCNASTYTINANNVYTSYLWSDGSTGNSMTVTSSGTYWLEAPIGCGTVDRDSIVITLSNPSISLGPDVSFCADDSITFSVASPYVSYLWNDGSTNATLTENTAGTYWLEVTDANGCIARDSVDIISVFPLPIFSLGNDTSLCIAGPYNLSPTPIPAGTMSYLWSNASLASNINVSGAGTYTVWLDITDINSCTYRDSIEVVINPIPNVNLGPDISICDGTTATLTPGAFTSYLWNDGSTGSTLTINSVGTYWLEVTNAQGCTDIDSVNLIALFPIPNPSLGNDFDFCNGEIVPLTPGSFTSYLWSNGATSNLINITSGGQYRVTVTNAFGCTYADTINLTMNPLPIFSLPPDFKICPDSIYPISAPLMANVNFEWSDGTIGNDIIITSAGTFFATATDTNGCKYTDTLITVVDCPPFIFIPNTFTPNVDEVNPVFQVYGTNIKDVEVEIYNRWGQQIFEFNDINSGWNGFLKDGSPAPQGVYAYRVLYYTFNSSIPKEILGSINLIR